MRQDLPNLYSDTDRHGNVRYFARVWINGRPRKTRLRHPPGTPEFIGEYAAAAAALKAAAGRSKRGRPEKMPAPGQSLGWLAYKYFASTEFIGLDAKSQSTRHNVIEACLDEPLTPGSKLLMRDCPYSRVDAKHIKMLRDRKKAAPGAANNRKKYLSAMFGWAIEQADIDVRSNPCRDVKRIKTVSDGWYTWTVQDVAAFIQRHPKGTMPYLALCLMLFLGARRQDAIRLGPKNMRDGTVRYVPKKTSYTRKEESVKPVLRPLADAIQATATGIDTFLVTSRGKSFTDAGFGNWMRDRCDEAALPECTSHGLKKAAATIVANMGATDRQMMMLFDWVTEKMANVYTRKANKEKLAADAARLLGAFFDGTPQALIENTAETG